jgi:hypothetical protein
MAKIVLLTVVQHVMTLMREICYVEVVGVLGHPGNTEFLVGVP